VNNGMDLLNLGSGVKFIITGAVLLAAVLIDSFAKRARAASGVA
jgi:ABC-type xylose transport system permease subunit